MFLDGNGRTPLLCLELLLLLVLFDLFEGDVLPTLFLAELLHPKLNIFECKSIKSDSK